MIKPFLKGGFTAQLYNVLGRIPGLTQTQSMNALPRTGTRKLVSPRAGLKVSWAEIPYNPGVPPEDESLTTAGELLELGLMAALVDVPLDQLHLHPVAIRGAEMLAGFPSMLTVPGAEGLFRLNTSDTGPRVSPLLANPWPIGWNAGSFRAVQRTGTYGATAGTYCALLAGTVPVRQTFGPASDPLQTGRDIASLVHQDQPFLIPLAISAQLFAAAAPFSSRFPALTNEAGFVSYGGPVDLHCALGEASRPAMEACWKLKWTHKRSRPETLWFDAVAGRLHPEFLARGEWLVDLVGPYLPMVYAEGSPIHPDTPSGHAVLAGCGFTLLKAWFADGPVPSLGVTSLHRELDSVAWSMAVGRAWAGIHTRSSLIHGLRLGEAYAVQHLSKLRAQSVEPILPTTFTGFIGQAITI